MALPTAAVRMKGPDGVVRVATAIGTGPFDAACKAVNSLVDMQVNASGKFSFPWPHTLPHLKTGRGYNMGIRAPFCPPSNLLAI